MKTEFSVTKNGKPLSEYLYTWCENTKTFSSEEDDLVLDFSGVGGCAFITGSRCTFRTGSDCTFDTGWDCTFDTSYSCTFNTGGGCTFKTGSRCTFNTGDKCTFNTGYGSTFKTGWGCTFDTDSKCTFKTGKECVIVRRDLYEVIELDGTEKIKLNEYDIKGYKVIPEEHTITIDGKDIKLSEQSYRELKNQLT